MPLQSAAGDDQPEKKPEKKSSQRKAHLFSPKQREKNNSSISTYSFNLFQQSSSVIHSSSTAVNPVQVEFRQATKLLLPLLLLSPSIFHSIWLLLILSHSLSHSTILALFYSREKKKFWKLLLLFSPWLTFDKFTLLTNALPQVTLKSSGTLSLCWHFSFLLLASFNHSVITDNLIEIKDNGNIGDKLYPMRKKFFGKTTTTTNHSQADLIK